MLPNTVMSRDVEEPLSLRISGILRLAKTS